MNLREQIEKEITDKVMTKLASEKVELSLIDDILSDVRANGAGRDKARSLIRQAFSDLQSANEVLKRIKPRADRIEKASKKLESQVKELGIPVSGLPAQMKFAIGGQYTQIAKEAEPMSSAISKALGSIKQTGEL
jgi:hypothetical protein